ncbi:hypothetical protein GOP47_0014287 [Adiantum capillus-veneris]|uniref:Uncharacterized protein n=1 Tax=Adiantum capillus-veneris TaxID=13818 RepID=A0A9D4ULS2_ADICA|nr:hypothetical protein GOP47_0014287 [Adiantum capillus-veneris]
MANTAPTHELHRNTGLFDRPSWISSVIRRTPATPKPHHGTADVDVWAMQADEIMLMQSLLQQIDDICKSVRTCSQLLLSVSMTTSQRSEPNKTTFWLAC